MSLNLKKKHQKDIEWQIQLVKLKKFFHVNVDRIEAEKILEETVVGSFLLRESSQDNCFAISVKEDKNEIVHLLVEIKTIPGFKKNHDTCSFTCFFPNLNKTREAISIEHLFEQNPSYFVTPVCRDISHDRYKNKLKTKVRTSGKFQAVKMGTMKNLKKPSELAEKLMTIKTKTPENDLEKKKKEKFQNCENENETENESDFENEIENDNDKRYFLKKNRESTNFEINSNIDYKDLQKLIKKWEKERINSWKQQQNRLKSLQKHGERSIQVLELRKALKKNSATKNQTEKISNEINLQKKLAEKEEKLNELLKTIDLYFSILTPFLEIINFFVKIITFKNHQLSTAIWTVCLILQYFLAKLPFLTVFCLVCIIFLLTANICKKYANSVKISKIPEKLKKKKDSEEINSNNFDSNLEKHSKKKHQHKHHHHKKIEIIESEKKKNNKKYSEKNYQKTLQILKGIQFLKLLSIGPIGLRVLDFSKYKLNQYQITFNWIFV